MMGYKDAESKTFRIVVTNSESLKKNFELMDPELHAQGLESHRSPKTSSRFEKCGLL